MNTGIDVDADWGQQALVDGHRCDGHCVYHPLAHSWDGVGPHGDTAEAPHGRTKAWAAAVFAPKAHICPVLRLLLEGGVNTRRLSSALHLSLSSGSLFIDR